MEKCWVEIRRNGVRVKFIECLSVEWAEELAKRARDQGAQGIVRKIVPKYLTSMPYGNKFQV